MPSHVVGVCGALCAGACAAGKGMDGAFSGGAPERVSRRSTVVAVCAAWLFQVFRIVQPEAFT